MHPWAGYVLASNQVYMYLYLLPYALLLQRPKIKRTFKRLGLVVPAYIVVGIINAIINLILMSRDQVKNSTYTTVAWSSSIAVIVLCGCTLGVGIMLNFLFRSNESKIVAADDEAEDNKAFKKGKTDEEKKEDLHASQRGLA